jgi:predicted Zn-dependent protease
MSDPDRLTAFRAMVERNPNNSLARFGLASEALKAGELELAEEHFRAYLAMHDDEGNAYGRLAEALQGLGRGGEAREVLRKGMAAAQRHGHPGMEMEFAERLNEIED